jgi:hypothetical protein
MPNPSMMISNRFKDNSGILFVPFEFSMSCRQTILPSPVTVELQKPSRVFSIGGSQICEAKNMHNCYDKELDTRDSRALTHGQVVIN